jgi:Ca2+-binding RTX toxin-like protein
MWGNDGVNWLNGLEGADIMQGFGASDYYFVENAGDRVIEYAGGGDLDTVLTSISYTLPDNVERLVINGASGTFNLNLTGNGLANELTGNAGRNVIDGRGGADLMSGLGDNDTYFVDNTGDVIVEGSGGGSDFVFTSIDYTLSDDIERMSAADIGGTAALTLVGNVRDNEITGNDGANQLSGQGGSDILLGRGGADTFMFTSSIYVGAIDQLPDFQPGIDKIALDDGEFAGLSLGSLPADAFVSASSAQDAADRIIYNPATGALLFDADGTGATAPVQFATVHEGLSLSAGDFLVI